MILNVRLGISEYGSIVRKIEQEGSLDIFDEDGNKVGEITSAKENKGYIEAACKIAYQGMIDKILGEKFINVSTEWRLPNDGSGDE